MMASEISKKLKVPAMLRLAVMVLRQKTIIKVTMMMTTTRKATVCLIRANKSATTVINAIKIRFLLEIVRLS